MKCLFSTSQIKLTLVIILTRRHILWLITNLAIRIVNSTDWTATKSGVVVSVDSTCEKRPCNQTRQRAWTERHQWDRRTRTAPQRYIHPCSQHLGARNLQCCRQNRDGSGTGRASQFH